MAMLKTVGVKELKNNLSAYLREVRRGARIFVSDRDTIVAELREPLIEPALAGDLNPVVTEWASAGEVRLPSTGKKALERSPVRLEKGTALRTLDDLRRESGT
jgi:antitoxin (DNA-binding transcriptional repressor) of toxin-antitoxin stability system